MCHLLRDITLSSNDWVSEKSGRWASEKIYTVAKRTDYQHFMSQNLLHGRTNMA